MPTEWPTPLALIVPVAPPPLTLPPETTTVDVVVEPQPTAVTSHTPSNLLTPLPPPPLFRAASGLLRRAGFSGSTERGACREQERDFSSLPMLPPALPCASAAPAMAAEIRSEASAISSVVRTELPIMI